MRGRDHPHVHLQRLVAAHPLERAGLEHAQNLRLRGQRHVPDLVQKNGAVIALLEFADALRRRARKGPFLVAEQFAFQQILRDGRAVDRQKSLRMALAVMIYGPRHQLLARAAFPRDQRRRVASGQLPDDLENRLHSFAPPDDPQVVILRFQQRLVGNHPAHVPGRLEGVEHDLLEARHVEGFEQVIVSPQLHRLDGRLRRAVGRHHDDHLLGVHLAQPAKSVQAAHAAHPHVHDHQVGFEPGDQLQSLLAAVRRCQFDFRLVKYPAERVLHVHFIVN